MDINNFKTLSGTMKVLAADGFIDDFKAEENSIKALYSKKEYQPEDLKIVKSFRFEGMTNPDDESILFAIIAKDGIKGTLLMSYGAEQSQNVELVKQIKEIKNQ